MKTRLLFIITLFFFSKILFSQCPDGTPDPGYTCIPDDNFELALIDLALDDVQDDQVLTTNINGITSLDVSGWFISDMTGIEAFTMLQTLDCSFNNLIALDLFNNTELLDIDCSENFIGNSGNQLILPDNNILTSLKCRGNNLSSLNVDNYPDLQLLHCYNNQANLGTLSLFNNTKLIELNCHDSGVGSLDVTQCTLLEKLLCYNGSGSTNLLNSLDISNNTELTQLQCNGNNIGSLSFTTNTKLVQIICDANPLGSINVSMLSDLEWLWCWNTGLSSLDVSSNEALKRLDFGGNSITTGQLMLPNTDTLLYLWGYYNSLTGTINTDPYINLINMDFTGNNLTSIDVSNNTALTDLWVGDNDLTTIDVSNNPLIEDFDCWMNNLTGTLDVSMLTSLNRLWCYENQLSNINIKNGFNPDISVFNATSNMVDLCIQVDNQSEAVAGYPGWTIDPGTVYLESCPGLSKDSFDLSSISIYPNPTKDVFEIDLNIDVDYKLHNILGHEVLSGSFVQGLNKLDVSSISSGLYILNLNNDIGSISKKLVKN